MGSVRPECFGAALAFSRTRAWSVLVFVLVVFQFGARAESTEPKNQDGQLQIPLVLNVGLVGFDDFGKGSKLSEELEDTLKHALTSYHPSSHSEDPRIRHTVLQAEFLLDFRVKRIEPGALAEIEGALRSGLKPAEPETLSLMKDVRTYDVEVNGDVESVLDDMFASNFVDTVNEGGGSKDSVRAVIIINPRKKNLLAGDDQAPFRYRYTYGGVGYTQAWIGAKNYVVIDLAAGPCSHGHTKANEGAVVPKTFPRLRPFKAEFSKDWSNGADAETPKYSVLAGLTSLVISAVQYVFVPDIGHETIYFAEKIIVPIVVFRDHTLFNPFKSDTEANRERAIDTSAIRKEIEKMLLPDQELIFATAVHNLHDHKQISGALYSSLRADTAYKLHGTKYLPQEHQYIDSDSLLELMGDAGDMLAEGLLRASKLHDVDPIIAAMERAEAELDAGDLINLAEEHVDAVENGGNGDPAQDTGDTPDKHHISPSELNMKSFATRQRRVHRTKRGKSGKALPENPYKRSRSSIVQGSRILPVYVFSFASSTVSPSEPGLLFEEQKVVAATKDAVLVIQNNQDAVEVPYFADGKRLHVNPRKPTQHIVAGLVQSLGGIVPPYSRYSPPHDRIVENYIWSYGNHPFGPFSVNNGMSQIFFDMALRNEVLSRLNSGLMLTRDAISRIEHFARAHVLDDGTNSSWLDREYSNGPHEDEEHKRSPLAYEAIARLKGSIQSLVEQFGTAAHLLWGAQYRDAHRLTSSIMTNAASFHEYAIGELELMRNEIACCQVKYVVDRGPENTLAYAFQHYVLDSSLFFPGVVLLSICIMVTAFRRMPKKENPNERKRAWRAREGSRGIL